MASLHYNEQTEKEKVYCNRITYFLHMLYFSLFIYFLNISIYFTKSPINDDN